LAVKTIVSHVRGEKVEARIDTGARLVTRENMGQPEIQELLQPDLKKWLGEERCRWIRTGRIEGRRPRCACRRIASARHSGPPWVWKGSRCPRPRAACTR